MFGDICRAKIMSDVLINLKYNFRSNGNSGIDKLAKAVNSGDTVGVEGLLLNQNLDDICFVETNNEADGKIMDKVIKNYLPFIKEDDPETALEEFNKFRILCAHRKGHYGTDFFNSMTETILRSSIKKDFYKKPVMVNVNAYSKNLFNGDTGIVVRMKDGIVKVFIKNLTSFLFSDFPSHEDAFAMTVHKSQGSEFDHVLFVIPARLSPVVTRELLYTGITRAKKKITIAGTMEVIKEAVSLPVHRSSAITELIDSSIKSNL